LPSDRSLGYLERYPRYDYATKYCTGTDNIGTTGATWFGVLAVEPGLVLAGLLGEQYYSLANTGKGFVRVTVDPVDVSDYTSVVVGGWMYINPPSSGVGTGYSSYSDVIKLWASGWHGPGSQGRELSLGLPVRVSAKDGNMEGVTVTALTDGSQDGSWVPVWSTEDKTAWIEIDLQQSSTITGVRMYTLTRHDDIMCTLYKIYSSSDGVQWTLERDQTDAVYTKSDGKFCDSYNYRGNVYMADSLDEATRDCNADPGCAAVGEWECGGGDSAGAYLLKFREALFLPDI
jgi:hypothetical protein